MDQTDGASSSTSAAESGVASGVGASGSVKFSKSTASKVLQEQVAVGMCKEALIRALGEYFQLLV